jgi:hypothetical protein
MKSTIFKYPIEITDDQILQLPLDAQILCVKEQNGRIVLYALVNLLNRLVPRYIFCRGTGHSADNLDCADWIDTVMLTNGLVFHFFADSEY